MYTVRQVPGNSEEGRFATKAEVLEWIYQQMLRGASYAEASREASEQFEISGNREVQAETRNASEEGDEMAYPSGLPVGNISTPEQVSDTTNDKIISRAVSRFEMIEIEGIEGRSGKRKGNDGENGSDRS